MKVKLLKKFRKNLRIYQLEDENGVFYRCDQRIKYWQETAPMEVKSFKEWRTLNQHSEFKDVLCTYHSVIREFVHKYKKQITEKKKKRVL